ncbi:4'-phosphopantetheine phosphatase isoform X2 [Arctopsyche grandis]|uniref:4'-phosphopantetheine phosphatase isoform X2 n=1 Tax=Arctopsyche grandis TaxID=121162 RepID=UPI00406D6FCA
MQISYISDYSKTILNTKNMDDSRLCPLLRDPAAYNPDTLDLIKDTEAREFWLDCFENLINKYVSYALQSDSEDSTVETRAQRFRKCYVEAIGKIRDDPLCYGILSVRLLLDLKENCLRSQKFDDLWLKQKATENDAALNKLSDRLKEIDSIDEEDNKWTELCNGLLAGNMFDWGARAISEILETNSNFGLKEALGKIQKRPWLVDGLDRWLNRLKCTPHTCSAIFVDNSGVDIVLGVLPFVRQLLLRNTNVILCANSKPALNDTTYRELTDILIRVSDICQVIKEALEDGRLIVMENGQTGPCLDLRTLDTKLCTAMRDKNVDLLIIEGMGRALHTNLTAEFKCECLKMAVVKNPWLAKRLGGDIFSVIFQYET